MGSLDQVNRGTAGLYWRLSWALVLVAAVVFLGGVWWLRRVSFFSDPLLNAYLEIVGSFLAFTYAANALVRFRGMHDRSALILAFGFVLSALIETGAAFGFYSQLSAGMTASLRIPLAWMVSRTLLAMLLVAALVVERHLPISREPGKEIAASFLMVGAVAYVTSAVYLGASVQATIHPGTLIPRSWDLIPAIIFLVAAIGYRRRLRTAESSFDRALGWAAGVNVVCHLVASQSQRLLDAPFTLAQILKLSSYALVLAGALLDNARLFDQVRHMAVSDGLTGLANYRRLLTVMEGEIERHRRTGRPFSVLLLDMDGLKVINDRYGHLVGSRALCRLGNVLRVHCRAMDTAARYGGDEFAVILAEAGPEAANRVAKRICERLAADGGEPPLTVSFGAAVFPKDGDTIEKLLGAADRALYRMKGRGNGVLSFSRIAACL